jgi:hypothetical protein
LHTDKERISVKRLERKQLLLILFFLLACVLMALFSARFHPYGIDWYWTFRPAAQAILVGESPYTSPALKAPYAGAPWGLLVFIPLAFFPEVIGRGFIFVISLLGFAYAGYRLGARPFTLTVFLLSPPVLHSLQNANIDWIPILGYSLSPWLGLFFIAVKPQMGSVVALYWLVESYRKGGIRAVIRTFAPITVVTLVSFLLYGWWPQKMFVVSDYAGGFNASLWPVSIPLGLVLLVASLRQREVKYAISASPCLSPHVLFHSWSGVLAALFNAKAELVTAVVGLWLLVALQLLS